jgi:hypothetical protein
MDPKLLLKKRKFAALSENRTMIAQPIASHVIDSAIPRHTALLEYILGFLSKEFTIFNP